MKNSRFLRPLLLTVALTACVNHATAQSTDGTVTYTVTTLNYTAAHAPNNVTAVWVVDSNGKFVKTLCRHAATRIAYLYKWIADRGTYTGVDGVTSATLATQPQTHPVTWDCRNTNGVLLADGVYTVRAEYTSANAQGPVCSNICSFLKGSGNAVSNYLTYYNLGGTFTNMSLTYKPYSEIAVTNITPASGLINSSIPVVVTVTNQTLNAAAFTVAVSNLTPSATLVGMASIASLAGKGTTNITVNWSTTGLAAGPYSVQATASTLINETNTANNVKSGTVTLSAPQSGDIDILSLTPASGLANASLPMQVRVTNVMSAAAGPFTVSLSNVTASATLIASQTVTLLAGLAATNVSLTWNTTGLAADTYQVKASVTPLTNETNTADNQLTAAVVLHNALHDLTLSAVRITGMVPPNVTSNVVFAVTNRGDLSESFTASLRDLTAAPLVIGTKATNVASFASVNVTIPWSTTNATLGYHTLEAGVTAVAGETSVLDNTNLVSVIVANGLSTNSLVAKSSVWKVLDQGLDISGAPWKKADYFDGFWASGPAPLGYGLTNIATVIGYGGNPSNRYVTTYFRREFTLDAVPMTITGRMMRTHGAILYLNGAEIARQNMPAGAVGAADKASGIVTGSSATNYFGFVIAASNVVVGRNLFTAELHLAAVTNTTAGFAVELSSVNPTIPATNAVNPSALTPDGGAQSGDRPGVSVTLVNAGNVTATCLVLIRDAATGAVLGSQAVGPLIPGETATVRIILTTFGATTGSRTLQAVTVINNVTNLSTIATSPFTLAAPDFSPRTVASAGSIGGRCNAVTVSGSTVYLGCGATLEVWDAANPASPVRKGMLRLPGIIEDLATSNTWVYAATGAAGVQIVDASTPTQLVHRATYDTSGHARRVTLAGTSLYVADGLGGVRVLNVASPASPTLAGAYQTTGPAQTVTFASPRLLVLDGQRGLQNLHASNPAAMSVTGTYSQVTAGLALTAVSGAALAADANGGLFRISAATPSNLTLAASTLLPAAGRSLATSGNALYVAAGAQGVLTLDATTLELKAANDVGGEASSVAVSGNTLYIAAGFAGCQAMSIASPLDPQPLGLFRTGARPVDAAASGSTLYVAADEGGLQIHSLQDLSLPTLQGAIPSLINSRCVAVAYPNLFVAEGYAGLKIYNIANPAAPVLRGSYAASDLSNIRRLALAGNRAVITDGRNIQLLSVANPAAPVLLATYEPGGFVFDLAAIPGEVYAACGGAGVKVLRMDTLGVDNTVVTPGPATAVAAVSNRLTVACGPAGWLTLNIDNAANPVLVKATPGATVFDATASGPLVYLADGSRTTQVANVSAPLTPVLSASFGNLTGALRVRAAQGVMLAAEDEAGLALLNASPGDINLNGIPDAWEQQIVNASVLTNGPVRSVLDVDSQTVGPNGFTYFQSYLAGLTPTNPNSVLAIRAATPTPTAGGQFVIQWQSVPGIKYVVNKSTNLTAVAAGFQPVSGAITATAALTSYTNTVTTDKAFFMVITTP